MDLLRTDRHAPPTDKESNDLELPPDFEEAAGGLVEAVVRKTRKSKKYKPSPPATGAPEHVSVILQRFAGERKNDVIRAVKDAREFSGQSPGGLAHASNLVDNVPAVVCIGVSRRKLRKCSGCWRRPAPRSRLDEMMTEDLFVKAEENYLLLKRDFDSGRINAEQFEKALNDAMIGVNTGSRYVHQDQSWVEATRPAVATKPSPEIARADFSEEVAEAARSLLRSGNKISAVKLVKDRTGCGLKEAKDYVESL